MVKRKIKTSLKTWRRKLVDKLCFAMLGFRILLKQAKYSALFCVFSLLFLYVLAQFQDGGVNWQLLWTNLEITQKINIFGHSIINSFTMLGSLSGVTMFILALMQGLAVTSIIFAIRYRQKDSAINGVSTSSIASILVYIALGCPTCGMTLLTPILSMFAGAGAVAMAEKLGIVLIFLAFALLLYTLVELGNIVFINFNSKKREKK